MVSPDISGEKFFREEMSLATLMIASCHINMSPGMQMSNVAFEPCHECVIYLCVSHVAHDSIMSATLHCSVLRVT